MYIRITSRCNMACAHCGFSCSANHGKHMDMWTFQKALDFALDLGEETIELGGGEPTLHPHFFKILRRSMAVCDVWLATNGSRKNTMLRMANIMDMEDYGEDENEYDAIVMRHDHNLAVDLSTDSYHDRSKVDDYVWNLWHRRAASHNFSSFRIRNNDGKIIDAGRAIKTKCAQDYGGCIIPAMMIEPDGTIKACSRPGAPKMGTVFDPKIPKGWNPSCCHKQQENLESEEDQKKYPIWVEGDQ